MRKRAYLILASIVILMGCQPLVENETTTYGVVSFSPERICFGSPSMRARVTAESNLETLQLWVNDNYVKTQFWDTRYSFFLPQIEVLPYSASINLSLRDDSGEKKAAWSITMEPPFISQENIHSRILKPVPSIIPWGDTEFFNCLVKMTVDDQNAPVFHIFVEDQMNIISYGVFRLEDSEFTTTPTPAQAVHSFAHRIMNLGGAVMDNGLISMSWQTQTGPGAWLSQSSDRGLSWSEPVKLDQPDPSIALSRLDVIGASTLTLSAYAHNQEDDNPYTATLAISEDEGQSWHWVTIENRCNTTDIEITELPDNSLLTALFDEETELFKLKRSTDGGYSWQDFHSFPKMNTEHYGQFPKMSLKRGPGNSLIAHYHNGNSYYETLEYCSISTDNGSSWSPPKSLHDELYLSQLGGFSLHKAQNSIYAVGTNHANIIINRADQAGENWTASQFLTHHFERLSMRNFTLTQTAFPHSFIHENILYLFWLDRSNLNFCQIKLDE